MYFLSEYLVGQFRLMMADELPAEPDEAADDAGDFCAYCGAALAEHDRYCRGCGGSKSIVSFRGLADDASPEKRDEPPPDPPDPTPPLPDTSAPIVDAARLGKEARVRAYLPADVNAANRMGETALMWAVRTRRRKLVALLLAAGADPNLRTCDAPNCVRLREGACVERERAPGQSALIWATAVAVDAYARMLLSHGADPNLADDWGQTPLLWAALEGNLAVARLLLAAGAAVNQADDIGRTPLLAAAYGGHAALVSLLRRAGADTTHRLHREFGGLTLVHAAALSNDEETLSVAAAGADLNACDSELVTPLTAAIAEGHSRTARALIALGADVDARGGRAAATPLWAANWHRDDDYAERWLEDLLAAGADPNVTGLFEEPPLLQAVGARRIKIALRLIDAGANLLATDRRGTTVLMQAAACSSVPLVQLLLDRGLDANAARPDGRTALMFTANPTVIRLLVRFGADVNAQTETGETALMFRRDHHLEAVQTLLDLGADPSLQNSSGQTVIDIASRRAQTKLLALFQAWQEGRS